MFVLMVNVVLFHRQLNTVQIIRFKSVIEPYTSQQAEQTQPTFDQEI